MLLNAFIPSTIPLHSCMAGTTGSLLNLNKTAWVPGPFLLVGCGLSLGLQAKSAEIIVTTLVASMSWAQVRCITSHTLDLS